MTSEQAFQAIAQACLDWCSDTGTCHFCRYHSPSIPHEDWCPVRDYEHALAHGSVRVE